MGSEHSSGQAGGQPSGQSAFLTGKTFGGYRIGETLGSGAAGAVYVAEPTNGGDKCALRVFTNLDLSRDKNLAARLIADMQKACAVTHPNLVPVRDIGTADFKGKRYLYVAMERLAGESLESRLERQNGQPLPLAEALHIANQVGAALAAIHRSGGTHRHLCPGSIFLAHKSAERTASAPPSSDGDKVYLLDLGSALVPAGDGHPAQGKAAPVKGGKIVDDIRGLAQLIQDMLSGNGDSAAAGSQALLPLHFRHPKIPARVDAVLRSVLGDTLGPQDKTARFESVAGFMAALFGTGDLQPTIGVWSQDGRALPRSRPSSSSGMLWAALVAVLIGAVVGYWLYSQETPPVTAPVDTPQKAPPPSSKAAPEPQVPVVAPAVTPVPDVAVDAGVHPTHIGPWPPRPGKIPPLRDAEPEPHASAPAPATPSSPAPAAKPAAVPAAPSSPVPAAKPPAPPQGPGAASTAPGQSGQKEVK